VVTADMVAWLDVPLSNGTSKESLAGLVITKGVSRVQWQLICDNIPHPQGTCSVVRAQAWVRSGGSLDSATL